MFPDRFESKRLILRPLQANDAQAIFDSYGQDQEVTRYLTWRPVEKIEETRKFVDMSLRAESSQNYMVILKPSGDVIGAFDLRRSGRSILDFGYVLARPHWGQGFMTEAYPKSWNGRSLNLRSGGSAPWRTSITSDRCVSWRRLACTARVFFGAGLFILISAMRRAIV